MTGFSGSLIWSKIKYGVWCFPGDRPVSGGRIGIERRPDPVRESEERPMHDVIHTEEGDYRHEMNVELLFYVISPTIIIIIIIIIK